MKYIIIGDAYSGKHKIKELLEANGISKIGKLFTNTKTQDNFFEKFSTNELNEIFINNAYLFMNSKGGGYYEGLLNCEYEENDIFFLTPSQFANIPVSEISKQQMCLIWIDNSFYYRNNRYKANKLSNKPDLSEGHDVLFNFTKYIYSVPNSSILYFSNEDPVKIFVILFTLYKHPDLIKIYELGFN